MNVAGAGAGAALGEPPPKLLAFPSSSPWLCPCVPALRACEQGEERLPAALALLLCLGEGRMGSIPWKLVFSYVQ